MTFVSRFRNAGIVGLLVFLGLPALADEPRLAEILSRKNRETFDLVSAYVAEHPNAADVDAGYRWLFETARKQGWEADALPIIERFAERTTADLPTRQLARQTRTVGLARTGKGELALDLFEEGLAGVGLRSAGDTLDFATGLASVLQTSGQGALSKEVYDRLSRKFFLNAAVRQFCDNRAGKLELLGKKAPDLGIEDLSGTPIAWSDFSGKLTLIDFWATNCPPCLEEFPSLKQLHADYQKQGFEIVGISLDEDRAVVDAFQEQAKLPWRLALSRADRDATRERFRVVTIPSMFLVDAEGRVAYVDVRGDELRRVVERTLKRAP